MSGQARGRRFSLVQELGSGAFGTVYLAEMESLGGFKKNVALKILNPELNSFDEASQRLRDEARLLGKLRHRHIVQVDDLIRLDGRWAVVMEHVTGYDLEVIQAALVKADATVPPLAAIEICQAVSTALDVAFTSTAGGSEPLRVVHRDIKPSNVRLTPEGEVKVLDFGIARADFSGREAKTGRVRYGSIGYMSPERLLGEPEVPEGDVFAVGCVLFELITGTALGRVELGPDQQVEQVKEARSKLVAALEEGGAGAVSEELGGLLEETLAYKPEGRPKAAHVADRLRRAGRKLEGEDLVAFAQRFVVQVADLIDDQTRPARGSFLEEGTLAESLDEDKTNPTLVFDVVGLPTGTGTFGFEPEDLGLPDDTPAQTEGVPSAEVATPPPEEEEPSRMGMFIALGVAAVLVVGGGVWAMQSMQQGAETGPTVVAPAEPVTEPAVEPVDEPAVVAEPVAEPVDEPVVVEVDPAEEKAPTVAPATQPARVKARPPPPVPVPVVEPAPETTGEVTLLRSVKFAVAGASSVSASCGGVTGQGATSALLRQVPAGSCSVSAVVDGTSLSGTVVVDKPRGVDCTVEGGALSCR